MSNLQWMRQLHADEGAKLHALLMSAAGAGIGFALHETSDQALSWSFLPIALAIVTWAISFGLGIFSRRYMATAVGKNIIALELNQNDQRELRNDQMNIAGDLLKKSRKFVALQEMALLIGVLLFFSGHLWKMSELNVVREEFNAAKATSSPPLDRPAAPHRPQLRHKP